MGIKKYRPTTSTLRFRTGYTFEEITKKSPEKSLLKMKHRTGGRNNSGE